ncbi:hypothetical protein GCM10007877_39360 [Marinibactrum halimedae]|uniref:Uncharacterized protein n=1 Tax=Marinibactrum halimedae TaxID=1444977 RepID=A0AA37TB63_9GAMM|nr:hypothetical protein GCM10007877_39360 [Marinibactrum halimedae]
MKDKCNVYLGSQNHRIIKKKSIKSKAYINDNSTNITRKKQLKMCERDVCNIERTHRATFSF